jgi:hypothetical protein
LRLGRNLAHSKSGKALESLEPLAHTNIPPRYTHPQMPRRAICSHPQAAAITASLDLIGTRKTARQFHVSLPAVNRHKQHVREETGGEGGAVAMRFSAS